jgi:putative membrane protein
MVVTAIMIKLADKLFSGFEVEGFSTALIIAFVMALAGMLFSYIL